MCGEEKLLNHDCWGTLKPHLDNIPKMMKEADDKLKTEGVKYDQGKPPVSMVPKELIYGAARAFEYGARKYQKSNFKKGMDWSRVTDALMRHTLEFSDKKDNDDESGLPHLYHMAACVGMLLYYYENKVGKDDR